MNVQERQAGGVTLRASLPPGWRLRDYVANHHYVELEDPDGKVYRLKAVDLIRGACRSCSQEIYVTTRMGAMKCPHCLGEVDWVWGDARLSFAPEAPSKFSTTPPPPPPVDGDGGGPS